MRLERMFYMILTLENLFLIIVGQDSSVNIDPMYQYNDRLIQLFTKCKYIWCWLHLAIFIPGKQLCQTVIILIHGITSIHNGMDLNYSNISQYSYSLGVGWSEDWIPVGARFSAPVQTGPGVYPASYTLVTGYFLGVKWLRRGDHPTPSSTEFKERVQLHLYLYF
jgi:hypothetical protein